MGSSKIYILVGGAGSGKTTLLNLVKESSSIKSQIPTKYSTRDKRGKEDDIEKISFSKLSSFRFVYSMQDNFYGFKQEDLIEPLKKGLNVFIIISDLRTIREMQAFFGELVIVLYIFRNMTQEEFELILKERKKGKKEKSNKSENIRKNRLYLIQRQYIENITTFDNVILNRKNNSSEMLEQVKNIVNNSSNNHFTKNKKGPVIFLIAAASGAGKRTLMNAMWNLGRKSITVIKKETNRDKQLGDGDEIIPGVKDLKEKNYEITYPFNENLYGIDTEQIWDNLKLGLPQIVITNMQQFEKFKQIFGNLTVNIYLHSTRTKEEILEFQTKKLKSEEKAIRKVQKIDVVHSDYIENISKFRHILLNTIEKEDLWDQMFNLINSYKACR